MTLEKYLKNHPKKHIIFDLDETILTLLIDWTGWKAGIRKIVAKIDPVLADKIPNQPRMGTVLYNTAIKKHGQRARKALLKFCEDFEIQRMKGYNINKTLIDFIKTNYKKYNLYLWSSNHNITVLPVLKELKIFNCFKKIVTKDNVLLKKPEPDGFYIIFNKKGSKLKDYLFIGNDQNDCLSAKAAGIDYLDVKKLTV